MIKEKVLENKIVKTSDIIITSNEIETKMEKVQEMLMIYSSAIKEITTKLEILDSEFKIKRKRNPIEYIKSRVKSLKSIIGKLERSGLDVSLESARNNLKDIAGVRVICSFLGDIYEIAEMLKSQDDITVIMEKDYIKYPKPNGYRSLHLVLEIPIFFSEHVEYVPVEVQIRTIAMDFWASLEHKLYYKTFDAVPISITNDLKECADVIASTDRKMQEIQKRVEKLN